MLDISTATFIGPQPDDLEVLQWLPLDYRELLLTINGCILFGGGLHLRGACFSPDWHSLRQVWIGPDALSRLYPTVQTSDIPFAQDVCGDQFLIRDGSVIQLDGETGDIEELSLSWQEFLAAATKDPVQFLSLEPLIRFTNDGGVIAPGQLLSVLPPFFTVEAANGVSLAAISAMERIRFLAYLAAQIRGFPEGTLVRIKVTK
jgi:hypothetical protein